LQNLINFEWNFAGFGMNAQEAWFNLQKDFDNKFAIYSRWSERTIPSSINSNHSRLCFLRKLLSRFGSFSLNYS